MSYKILTIITVIPYQIAMLMVILGANYRVNQYPVIGRVFDVGLTVVTFLFFVISIIVAFLQMGVVKTSISSDLSVYHWLSFLMSSQFLSFYRSRLRDK